jgi:serine/threonine protein kinase
MLVELNKLDNKHLIKLLFAFTQNKEPSLIFPLAEYSLDTYFKENDPRKYTKEKKARHTAWIFEQFSGLAHGLSQVHENKQTRRAELSSDENAIGYHHDLKHPNILLFHAYEVGKHPFEALELEFGRLQISDFGLGKFRTKFEGTGTDTIQGTITYRAPEVDPDIDPKEKPKQNRKYDIWCIGCMLLELLVWLFHGPEGYERFESLRLVDFIIRQLWLITDNRT